MSLILFIYSFKWEKIKKLISNVIEGKMFPLVSCELIPTVSFAFKLLYLINIFSKVLSVFDMFTLQRDCSISQVQYLRHEWSASFSTNFKNIRNTLQSQTIHFLVMKKYIYYQFVGKLEEYISFLYLQSIMTCLFSGITLIQKNQNDLC